MAYEFKLPDLGEGLTEGEIARWLVSEGDEVAEDAARELAKLGDLAEPALRRALSDRPSPEVRKAVESLLARLEMPTLAAREFRLGDFGSCATCALANIGRAFDLASEPDSALAALTSYESTPSYFKTGTDQWMLADTATELDAARMLTLKAAAAKDRRDNCALEASMAKLAASEAAHRAADKAMQVLASAGYRRGSVVERLFRDVRATEIYQGTSEAQRMIIAANILANA